MGQRAGSGDTGREGDAEMILLALSGITWFIAGIIVALWVGPTLKAQQLHCPACGGTEYRLQFDSKAKLVNRTCDCGCTVTQPPAYPDLFKDKS